MKSGDRERKSPRRWTRRFAVVVSLLAVLFVLTILALPHLIVFSAREAARRYAGGNLDLATPSIGLDRITIGPSRFVAPEGSIAYQNLELRYRILKPWISRIEPVGLEIVVDVDAITRRLAEQAPSPAPEHDAAPDPLSIDPTAIIAEQAEALATLLDLVPIDRVNVPDAKLILRLPHVEVSCIVDLSYERVWDGTENVRFEIANELLDGSITLLGSPSPSVDLNAQFSIKRPQGLAQVFQLDLAQVLSDGTAEGHIDPIGPVRFRLHADGNGEASANISIPSLSVQSGDSLSASLESFGLEASFESGQLTANSFLLLGPCRFQSYNLQPTVWELNISPDEVWRFLGGFTLTGEDNLLVDGEIEAEFSDPLANQGLRNQVVARVHRLGFGELELSDLEARIHSSPERATLFLDPISIDGIPVNLHAATVDYLGAPFGETLRTEWKLLLGSSSSEQPLLECEGQLLQGHDGEGFLVGAALNAMDSTPLLAVDSQIDPASGAVSAKFRSSGEMKAWEPIARSIGGSYQPILESLEFSGGMPLDGEVLVVPGEAPKLQLKLQFADLGLALLEAAPVPEEEPVPIGLSGLNGTIGLALADSLSVSADIPRLSASRADLRVEFDSLRGDFALLPGPTPLALDEQRLQIAGIQVIVADKSMEIKDFLVRAAMPEADRVQLREMRTQVFGGTVSIDPFDSQLADPAFTTNIVVEDLDASEISELFPEFGLGLEGHLEGRIPVGFADGKPVLSEGNLAMRGEGSQRIQCIDVESFTKAMGISPDQQIVRLLVGGIDVSAFNVTLLDPDQPEIPLYMHFAGRGQMDGQIIEAPSVTLRVIDAGGLQGLLEHLGLGTSN